MSWYWYPVLLATLIVGTRAVLRSRMTDEELRLEHWQKLAHQSRKDYRFPDSLHDLDSRCSPNPLERALLRRSVLEALVSTGHAHVAKSVMVEVDQIIATVEANHYAMDQYGYGHWELNKNRSTSDHLYYNWVPNDSPRFAALDQATDKMVDRLNDLIEYVKGVGLEGVEMSVETAKLHLQMSKQDLTAEKSAMLETSAELVHRPL